MALTEIEYGALASSETMNSNFQYLDNRISSVSETVASNQAVVNSNIASINSTISTTNESLQSEIEKLNTTLEEKSDEFSEAAVYITTYINGSSWYREHFSDRAKTTRIWLEQGGVCGSRSSTSYLKSFSNTNYTLTLGTHDCNYEHGGISGKSSSGFSHYDGKGWSYDVDWYACGV